MLVSTDLRSSLDLVQPANPSHFLSIPYPQLFMESTSHVSSNSQLVLRPSADEVDKTFWVWHPSLFFFHAKQETFNATNSSVGVYWLVKGKGVMARSALSVGTVRIRMVFVLKLPCFHPWTAMMVLPGLMIFSSKALLSPKLWKPPSAMIQNTHHHPHRILLSTSVCQCSVGTPRGSGYQNG